ncbi:MAG TPA: folate family ECF transporter S component [Caproicibacter sp.]|nr:folate family ECF transporter S component [Caproicibacter sp.]
MKKIFNSIRLSAQDFGNIRTIAACGMLLALNVVLVFFRLNISSILRISFSYLAIAAAGMLFGPIAGGVVGAAGDLISYFIQPTGPYFPGFTLNAFLSGFIYGLVLYRKPVKLARVFSAKVLLTVLIGFVLNPLWLSMMYGKGFLVVVATRITANLIMLPIETVMLLALLKILEKGHVVQMLQRNN